MQTSGADVERAHISFCWYFLWNLSVRGSARASWKSNKTRIARIRGVTYVRRNFRYNRALNFHTFRRKFEAVGEVMDHLTYTRKRYNRAKPLRDWSVSTRVREDVTGCYTSLPVHLLDSFVHLPTHLLHPSPLPRAVVALWNLLSFRVIAFWMSRLNAMKHAECIGRLLRCIDSWGEDHVCTGVKRREPHFPRYPFSESRRRSR